LYSPHKNAQPALSPSKRNCYPLSQTPIDSEKPVLAGCNQTKLVMLKIAHRSTHANQSRAKPRCCWRDPSRADKAVQAVQCMRATIGPSTRTHHQRCTELQWLVAILLMISSLLCRYRCGDVHAAAQHEVLYVVWDCHDKS